MDEPPQALPLALLFSFGIIGALFLLMLILMGVTIACCVVKKRWVEEQDLAGDGGVQTGQVLVNANIEQSTEQSTEQPKTDQPRTPYYSKVVKLSTEKKNGRKKESSPPPPLPPPPVFATPSPPPITFKPQEIVSYNMDIPKTFIPYAPPPPICGLASTDNLHKISTDESPYNIPVDSLADYDEVDSFDESSPRKRSRAMSLQYYSSSQQTPSDDESYYDRVESIQEEGSNSLTSSLQLNHSQGHYQSPRRRPGRYSHGNNPGYSFESTFIEALEPSMLHSSVSSIGSETPLPYGPIYDCPKHMKKNDEPLEISCHNIMEIEDLGNGRFGQVVLAATVNLALKDLNLGEHTDKNRSFLVAVKKQKKDADASTKNAFQDEINFLSKLKHANVVRLLGVCSMASSPFIVVEYMENGDLNQFLRKQKLVADNTQHLQDGEATPLILLYMAVQISSGMRYLASRKFIHRDLATRNCLVGREFVVKISDFGMSQNLYESYYFRVQGQLILPIRWMAYESFYGKFSVKSDIWSFGVTLWEIYHMAGCEPYGDFTDEELINDATRGKKRTLLEQPEICPQAVYDVMLRCWVHEPSMRADFEEIYSRLFLAYMTRSQEASY